jgi:hypothetical protein
VLKNTNNKTPAGKSKFTDAAFPTNAAGKSNPYNNCSAGIDHEKVEAKILECNNKTEC